MSCLKIYPSKNTPLVELSSDGKLTIHGRSILDDAMGFYNPVLHWISESKSLTFTIEIQLEYLDTSSTKMILHILKAIKQKYGVKNMEIHWIYESDDEDMFNLGKDLEMVIRRPFHFYELHPEKSISIHV